MQTHAELRMLVLLLLVWVHCRAGNDLHLL
jgi:hypothetical protein